MILRRKNVRLIFVLSLLTVCNLLLLGFNHSVNCSLQCTSGKQCIGFGADYKAASACSEYCGKQGSINRLQFLSGTCTESCLCKTKWRCVSGDLTEMEFIIFVTAYFECSDNSQ